MAIAVASAAHLPIWRTAVDGPVALQAAPIARRPSSSRDSVGASARMVFSTQEHVAHLVAAGSSPFLRIWNIQNETCIGVLPTGSDASSVTCLASSSNGNLLAAGFGNGIVHLYDCRQRYSQICALMKHTSSVLNESALPLPAVFPEYRQCKPLFVYSRFAAASSFWAASGFVQP